MIKKNHVCQLFLSLVLLTGFSFASTAQIRFTLNISIRDGDRKERFYLADLNKGQIIDSASLVDQHLKFQGELEDATVARVFTTYKDTPQYFVLYLDTGRLAVDVSMQDFGYPDIQGSASNEEWVKTRDALKSTHEERDQLMTALIKERIKDTNEVKSALKRVDKIDSITQNYRLKSIKSEPPTYFTLHELFYLRTDLTSNQISELMERFPDNLKNSKDGKYLSHYLQRSRPRIGDLALNVQGNDSMGTQHELTEFKGKYVLLEFWASWCGPCRQQNPELIQTYRKYKSKGLEIVGFSLDGQKNDWLQAVRKDAIPWINLSDSKAYYSLACASYHVRAIPANFLIDPKGIIVAIDLDAKSLDEKMAESLSRK